jgi:NAD-dependent deacetylase
MYSELFNRIGVVPSRDLYVVVLTGAGVSAESGVPIFRGKGSMWENPIVRKLASRACPPWNNKGTWEFYEWRRQLVSKCNPNPAHYTFVEMESFFKNFCLITQNVDGLHRRAGNKKIVELHGNMWKGRCLKDGEIVDLPDTPLKALPPIHSCGEALRPHVVQFGEPVLDLDKALKETMSAELFFVIGTSGVVSPARDLPLTALKRGAKVIEINPVKTPLTPYMTLSIRGKAAEVLPRIWKEFLKGAV